MLSLENYRLCTQILNKTCTQFLNVIAFILCNSYFNCNLENHSIYWVNQIFVKPLFLSVGLFLMNLKCCTLLFYFCNLLLWFCNPHNNVALLICSLVCVSYKTDYFLSCNIFFLYKESSASLFYTHNANYQLL